MLILVIGDFHIPDREKEIPFEILQEIQQYKFEMILCTGDLTSSEIYDTLKAIAPITTVTGNMDYYFGLREFPRSQTIQLKKAKLGLIHGSGIRPRGNPDQLSQIARDMKVDLLISGHIHALSIRLHNDILLLNPGSATGSWGGGISNKIPSFLILEELEDQLKITSVNLKKRRIFHSINIYNPVLRQLQ